MEALILEPSLYTVKAILILDNDGDRLFAKYYDDTYPSVKEQKAFEKNIFNKTHRTDTDAYGSSELPLRLIEPDAEVSRTFFFFPPKLRWKQQGIVDFCLGDKVTIFRLRDCRRLAKAPGS
uniref:Coatomer subunit zeta n=1 Tax=Papio anubis TaxID=9555 RepID=A0A8I5N1H3_PAPAN